MYRIIFYTVLIILFARAIIRLWKGFVEGVSGGRVPPDAVQAPRGVQMVRDPVCGTFVVPGRAVTVSIGRQVVHFCSPACRDAYRARTA
jgi:uncharacterized protein